MVIILGGTVLWIKTIHIFRGEEESFAKTKFFRKWRKKSKEFDKDNPIL